MIRQGDGEIAFAVKPQRPMPDRTAQARGDRQGLAPLARRAVRALRLFIPINRAGKHRIKRRALAAGIVGDVAPIVFFLGVQDVPSHSVFLKHSVHRPARGQV